MNRRREDESLRNAGTFAALFGMLGVAGALLFLMASVMPALAAIPIILFAFVLLLAVQYAIFGWLLPGPVADDEDPEEPGRSDAASSPGDHPR